jgi:hypothetical protein
MNSQLNIFDGRQARDEGINKASDHAEAVNPGWNDQAFTMLKQFISVYPGEFMGEDFRAYCAMVDFPLPPHARAFGGVIHKAAKSGLIKKIRIAPVKNVKAHCAFASVWQAVKKAS